MQSLLPKDTLLRTYLKCLMHVWFHIKVPVSFYLVSTLMCQLKFSSLHFYQKLTHPTSLHYRLLDNMGFIFPMGWYRARLEMTNGDHRDDFHYPMLTLTIDSCNLKWVKQQKLRSVVHENSFSHSNANKSSDPYVSLLSGKSVPHHYPCEISVTNKR